MAAPIPPVPPVLAPRSSVGMKVVDIADNVIVKIIGLIWFAGSGYFEYLEVISDKTTVHMVLFAVSAMFGVALAFTRPVVTAASGLLTVAGPFIPKFPRKGDGV